MAGRGLRRHPRSRAFRPGQHPGFEWLETRQLLSGSDLTQDVVNLLENGTRSGSVTLDNVTLGSFLSASSVTVQFQNISQQGSDWSGTVSVSASTASVAIGQDFNAQIQGNGTSGSVGLSGSYTLNDQPDGQGSYQLSVADLTASVSDVLTASASNVQLLYDPAGSSSQSLAQIGSLSAQIIPFDNTQVTLSNLDVYEDGFSLQNATVGAGAFTLGSILSVDGPSLTLSGISYTAGSSLAGTISLGAGTATLFPGESGFTATVDGFQGSYTLNTNAFSLSASDADVAIGQVLSATATGLSIAYDPSAASPLTIASTTINLSSPDFPGLSAEATDFQASETGFSLASATLSDSSSIEVGGVLDLSGLEVTATGLSYQTDPPTGHGDGGVAATGS